MIKDNGDILLISETKIDSSFSTAQFHIDGYIIYRSDRNENGGGLLLYIRDDAPSDLLKIDPNFGAFYFGLNIKIHYYVAHIILIKTFLILIKS